MTIGSDVAVGAGSIVNKSLPEYSICAGNSIKVLRQGVVWAQERIMNFPSKLNSTLDNTARVIDAHHMNDAGGKSLFLEDCVGGTQLIPTKEKMQLMYSGKKYKEIVDNINELFEYNNNYWNSQKPNFLYVKYFYTQACMKVSTAVDDSFFLKAEEQFFRIYQLNPMHTARRLLWLVLK